MLRKIPTDISVQARQLHTQLISEDTVPDHKRIVQMLDDIANGQTQRPDDWALVQENFNDTHPCFNFFKTHRDSISTQLIVNGKKHVSVAIIRFTHDNERHVLLMRNAGMAASANVLEIQWTTLGARVDELEKNFLKDERRWDLYLKRTAGDKDLSYLMAAAIRQIEGIGIELTENDILNIRPINRMAAGFPDTSTDYRTEYFDVDLGERNLEAMINACASRSSTRFGHWSRSFKLSELKSLVKESREAGSDNEQRCLLTHEGNTHPIRNTTWFFLNALQLAEQYEIKPEGIVKDPWQLRNLNPIETAIRWVLQRVENEVQFTLFSEINNRLSSAQAHAYAAKAQMNEEDFAYTSMKPERLVLHGIIAHLTTRIKLENTRELEQKTSELCDAFFKTYPLSQHNWERQFQTLQANLKELIKNHLNDTEDDRQKLSAEDACDINRVKALFKITQGTGLHDNHQMIYHLCEPDIEIAEIIYRHEKYHAQVMPEILAQVDDLITSKNYAALETYPLAERQCFGITGPLASGKSISKWMIKSLLGIKNAAFIGSDEWNNILNQCLHLDSSRFAMMGGKLTLPEAWFVKVLIWKMMAKLEKEGRAPNWILETIDPSSIQVPEIGSPVIFINTADPGKAVERVKERGDKYGRYVSASAATGSYRWPWLNLIKTLEKAVSHLTLEIIDTDIMYAPENINLPDNARMRLANIVTVKDKILEIHNLNYFIFFIIRSFQVNPYPQNAHEIWLQPKPAFSLKALKEIDKLYDPRLGIGIKYADKFLSKQELFDLVNRLYDSARSIEKFWKASSPRLFNARRLPVMPAHENLKPDVGVGLAR